MVRSIQFAVLLTASFGCMGQEAFQTARDLAAEIIIAELDGGICHPAPIPMAKRQAMSQALSRIDQPGLPDSFGHGPLNLAVIADDVPTMERLVSLGYPLQGPTSTLLHEAASHNSLKALEFLIAQGVDPNTRSLGGATPLMSATADTRVQAARLLVAAGAKPNASTRGSALHYALACGNEEMIKLLLDAGATVDPKAREIAEKHGVALDRLER